MDKDIHVTETIRHAIHQSQRYPAAATVFKGGTALAKCGLVNRFSEDVDVSIVPPRGRIFGDARRRNTRREVVKHLLDHTSLTLDHHRASGTYTVVRLTYEPLFLQSDAKAQIANIGEVKVEYIVRDHAPGYHPLRTISSYIGETAAQTNPSLLEEYPALRPFQVLTAAPILSIVDKLDAMHWRSEYEDLKGIQRRPRDVYDLAALLSNDQVRATVNSDAVAALHADLTATLPSGLLQRKCARPTDGFGTSKAFQPGHPACEALRKVYDNVRPTVYNEDTWIEFDDALNIIKQHSDLL